MNSDIVDILLYSCLQVFCLVATCGQGEFPGNCKDFWKSLSDKNLPEDFLESTEFTVFGLGDSSYVYFNEAAKCFHQRFSELGAKCVLDMGVGDDKVRDSMTSRAKNRREQLIEIMS